MAFCFIMCWRCFFLFPLHSSFSKMHFAYKYIIVYRLWCNKLSKALPCSSAHPFWPVGHGHIERSLWWFVPIDQQISIFFISLHTDRALTLSRHTICFLTLHASGRVLKSPNCSANDSPNSRSKSVSLIWHISVLWPVVENCCNRYMENCNSDSSRIVLKHTNKFSVAVWK